MLKSENLTIAVSSNACNKNCPYCISKITGYDNNKYDFNIWTKNLKKALTIARHSNVTNIMITGKGEPLLPVNTREIEIICETFQDFPIEIQTNGLILPEIAKNMPSYFDSINTIAWSIDFSEIKDTNRFDYAILSYFDTYKEALEILKKKQINIRVTLNVTDHPIFDDYLTPELYISFCKTYGIDQITFRNIVFPSQHNPEDSNEIKWIKQNTIKDNYSKIKFEFDKYIKDKKGILVRTTSNGFKIYDIFGISYMTSDYCIQETVFNDEIRSLVYQKDGHLYTSWDSKASRLF